MSERPSFSQIFDMLSKNAGYKTDDGPSDFTIRPIKHLNETTYFQIIFTNCVNGKLVLKICQIPISQAITDVLNFSSKWKTVVNDQQLLSAPSTLAERLLAERTRSSKQGITFYDLHFESNNLLFINDGLMYSSFLESHDELKSLQMLDMNNAMGVKRNPLNWQILSFLKDRNVFVIDISKNKSTQLTFSGPDIGSGCTHYVIQEEFDRTDGMWWRPQEDNENEYHLLIEVYDESNVAKLIIPCYTFEFENEEYRFPQPGKQNAKSNLKILKINFNPENNEIFHCEVLELPQELFLLFSDYEYLTNAGWTPDGKFVWIQLADRLQNSLSTYLLSFEAFSSKSINKNHSTGYAVLYNLEVNSKLWVPINSNTVFIASHQPELPMENTYSCSSIIGQSIDGFNHLYLMGKYWNIPSKNDNFHVIIPEVSKSDCLTFGNWEVDIQNIWVDEKNEIVYFLGNKDDVLANHLYSVSYRQTKTSSKQIYQILQITKENSTVYFSPDYDWVIVNSSSLGSSVKIKLINIVKAYDSSEYTIYENLNPYSVILNETRFENHPTLLKYDIVDASGSEIALYGLLFTPNSDKPKKWPTLHYVYGGPCVRIVENRFNKNFLYFASKINSFGFAVLVCDGRGSTMRGLEFQGHVKNKLGTVELNDQIYFLQKAAVNTGLIDIDKVAIYGSSYGGYLTIMAMFKHSNVYKCGFSCSPVVDFKYYDSAYTERYLGIPAENKESYQNASVLNYVSDYPKDRCRLTVAHGGMDENVHFLHTAHLLRYSNMLGINIKFLFYPSSRHGIRDGSHLDTHLIKFLYKHLTI